MRSCPLDELVTAEWAERYGRQVRLCSQPSHPVARLEQAGDDARELLQRLDARFPGGAVPAQAQVLRTILDRECGQDVLDVRLGQAAVAASSMAVRELLDGALGPGTQPVEPAPVRILLVGAVLGLEFVQAAGREVQAAKRARGARGPLGAAASRWSKSMTGCGAGQPSSPQWPGPDPVRGCPIEEAPDEPRRSASGGASERL